MKTQYPAGPRAALICGLLFLSACNGPPVPRPDHPRLTPSVALQDVNFHSASLERDVTYRVILPAKGSSAHKLRAVYLLHGGGADYKQWSNDSDVAQFAEHGLLLVMPEGASSYYTNARTRPKDRYEDFIVKDLIADVEARFPVMPDGAHRAIVGVSMGGFGAIKLALKYLGLYGFVGALSPAIDVPSRPFSIKRISQYRAHEAIFGAWGTRTRRDNDPFVLARSIDPAKMPFIFIRCGDKEGLLAPNQKFAELLAARKFQFEFRVEHGGHDWNQWNGLLSQMFASLKLHMN